MAANFWINSLKFKNGLEIPLEKNSIVVFVGANNCGKSTALNEIQHLLEGSIIPTHVVESLNVSVQGSEDEFLKRIEHRKIGNTYVFQNRSSNSGMDSGPLKGYWNSVADGATHGIGAVSNFFVKTLDTAKRLTLVAPAQNIDTFTELKAHPIQTIKDDTEKELLFSRYFKLAFGEDAIVNHGAGSSIPLHVGTRPVATMEKDRVSQGYLSELRNLPMLHLQGDGMKSFAGVFLSLFAEDYSVNLIDEPEAFLHPPQAYLLGQMIGQKLESSKQLFIATHSEHHLKGLLDSASDRLVVVRIHRDGTSGKVNVLNNADIKSIWNDSLLRHSNILDGLFHKRVVLVESDSDCRFFNAMTTAIVEHEQMASPDILFVQSGGKHRFPTVVKALQKIEVPLPIIGDFDLYHEENPVKNVFEELSGNWEDIQSDFRMVKQAIDTKRPELETVELKEQIDKIFLGIKKSTMPEDKLQSIRDCLKKSSPWTQAKASGKAYLPAGDATLAFNRIQAALNAKKIYILEQGEIEAFNKNVGGHGPKWVNKVLEDDLVNSKDLKDAREFIRHHLLDR